MHKYSVRQDFVRNYVQAAYAHLTTLSESRHEYDYFSLQDSIELFNENYLKMTPLTPTDTVLRTILQTTQPYIGEIEAKIYRLHNLTNWGQVYGLSVMDTFDLPYDRFMEMVQQFERCEEDRAKLFATKDVSQEHIQRILQLLGNPTHK